MSSVFPHPKGITMASSPRKGAAGIQKVLVRQGRVRAS